MVLDRSPDFSLLTLGPYLPGFSSLTTTLQDQGGRKDSNGRSQYPAFSYTKGTQ